MRAWEEVKWNEEQSVRRGNRGRSKESSPFLYLLTCIPMGFGTSWSLSCAEYAFVAISLPSSRFPFPVPHSLSSSRRFRFRNSIGSPSIHPSIQPRSTSSTSRILLPLHLLYILTVENSPIQFLFFLSSSHVMMFSFIFTLHLHLSCQNHDIKLYVYMYQTYASIYSIYYSTVQVVNLHLKHPFPFPSLPLLPVPWIFLLPHCTVHAYLCTYLKLNCWDCSPCHFAATHGDTLIIWLYFTSIRIVGSKRSTPYRYGVHLR